MSSLAKAFYCSLLMSLVTAPLVFASDTKSIEELMLMNEVELDSEAHRACLKAVISRKHGLDKETSAAVSYLTTIKRVARSKNHQVPQWMKEYEWRAGGDDASKCNEAALRSMRDRAESASQAERKRKQNTK